MPLKDSLKSFKSLSFFNFKAKRPSEDEVVQPQAPLYRHNKAEELVARINQVFVPYQAVLADYCKTLISDESRSLLALSTRALLYLKPNEILDTNTEHSSFELHKVGLRLPGNPLGLQPLNDHVANIRQALLSELGLIYLNSSLEMLGLITVLHIISKALLWFKPLISPASFQDIIAVVEGQRPVTPPQQIRRHEVNRLNSGDVSQVFPTNYSSTSMSNTMGTRPSGPRRQASLMSLHSGVPDGKRNSLLKLGVTLGLVPDPNIFNVNKELPEDALSRWVLDERSYGRERTLSECQKKLAELHETYEAHKNDKGRPPAPVSITYGYIDHALNKRRNGENVPIGSTHHICKPQSVQHLMLARIEAQAAADAAEGKAEANVKKARASRLSSASSANLPVMMKSMFSRSHADLTTAADEEIPETPRIPRRFLPLTASPHKQKISTLQIGAPHSVQHHASGAGLTSHPEISEALKSAVEKEAADNRAGRSNVANQYSLKHANVIPEEDPLSAPVYERTINVSPTLGSNVMSNTASPSLIATDRNNAATTEVSYVKQTTSDQPQSASFDHAEKLSRSASRSSTLAPGILSVPQAQSIHPEGDSVLYTLFDQEARAKKVISQLYQMELIFKKALDALAKPVFPDVTVQKVTDVAISHGWFNTESKDFEEEVNVQET